MNGGRDDGEGWRGGLDHPLVWAGVLAGTLVTLFVFDRIWWLSLPFVMSLVLYYVSLPWIDLLCRRGLSHGQALAVFLVLALVLTLVALTVAVPWLVMELETVEQEAPRVMAGLQGILERAVAGLEQRFPVLREEGLSLMVEGGVADVRRRLIEEGLPEAVVQVLEWMPGLVLIPYITFFMLKDGSRFKRLAMAGVPNAYFEQVLMMFHRVNRQIRQFFRGLMGMTLLDTVSLAAGLWMIGRVFGGFGVGQSLFLGLLCAVLSWVPYLGTAVGGIAILVLCLTREVGAVHLGSLAWEPETARLWLVGSVAVLFTAVRALDDFVYAPLTVGRSLSVHPLVTVLMIFAGGYIGGITGLLLAMPVLGIWMVLGEVFGQVWFDDRLRARHRQAGRLRRLAAARGLD